MSSVSTKRLRFEEAKATVDHLHLVHVRWKRRRSSSAADMIPPPHLLAHHHHGLCAEKRWRESVLSIANGKGLLLGRGVSVRRLRKKERNSFSDDAVSHLPLHHRIMRRRRSSFDGGKERHQGNLAQSRSGNRRRNHFHHHQNLSIVLLSFRKSLLIIDTSIMVCNAALSCLYARLTCHRCRKS